MILKKQRLSQFSRNIWLTLGMFLIVAITFGFYTYSEKQIDHANELRLQSYLLADELRQSSDDLTSAVRTYAMTGNRLYKQHYQEILDIRDGKEPRPVGYSQIYWDLVQTDEQRPRLSGQAVPLLELMRQAHFTDQEFEKLKQAKANSDNLTRIELAAMALLESTSPSTEANRLKALQMLSDTSYFQAKYDIMLPISEFYQIMEYRTLEVVHTAENMAVLVRSMLIAFGLLLVFTLWQVYRALDAVLGCSVDELQAYISRLGNGDFITSIPVSQGMENSVLGWLSATQTDLARIDEERKQMEQQNKEHLDQLAYVTRLGLMGEMASGIAHEVNQPLSAIATYTQVSLNLLKTEAPDLVKLSDILYKTQQQALRAGRIIHHMKNFSKSHTKHCLTTNINTLIHEADDLCVAELKQSGIKLVLDLENNLPPVYVDQIQIEQVIINLIRNSVDALQNLPGDQERRLTIHSHLDLDNAIQVRVKDNGPGLDEGQQQKIFTPFHSTKEDGMGMGLSISRSLIEAHDGTLRFNSEPGKGTTFYFTLPIETVESSGGAKL